MVFGYVLGFYLFKILNNWVCIYIFGYMFGFIYYLYYCKNRFKESFSKTPLFHDTNKRFLILSGSSLIKQITTYADRFILYPLMGGEKVAIYYASTIIAKCIALAVNPLNSLILSYLNISNKANRKYLVITLLCGSIICFSGYWLCLIISKPLLDILYPQYVNEALKLIKITTCTAMLDTLVYFSNPFLLKIFKPSFQIMLNLVSILIYGLSALFLLPSNGVVGICYSALISSIIKVSIILLISLTKVGNILLS